MLVFAASLIAHFWLESVRESLGFADADNPAVMMRFLNERIDTFHYSGWLFVLMGLSLVVAVLSIWTVHHPGRALLFRFSCTMGLFAAAYFFSNGVLRFQAPGTLLHMEGIDPRFGEAGYLAVQMGGTQGLASAGALALAMWVVSLSIHNFSERRLWIGVSWLGLATIAQLLGAFMGPLLPDSGLVYGAYVLGIAATVLWCIILGISMPLRTGRGSTTGLPPTGET